MASIQAARSSGFATSSISRSASGRPVFERFPERTILSLAPVSSARSKEICPASQEMLSAARTAISSVAVAAERVPPSRYIADFPRASQ